MEVNMKEIIDMVAKYGTDIAAEKLEISKKEVLDYCRENLVRKERESWQKACRRWIKEND
jgi:23S rRNA maturation-related 3'-5' exoribonuclease YhaM